MVVFAEATAIIGGRDAIEEFLACGIWPLSENCEFKVVRWESPISKVVVPMPKVTPMIGKKESEAAFEVWIVQAANQQLGNYCMTEDNSCTGLLHGWLNHVFELAGVPYQPRPEPLAHATKKRKPASAAA
jgi:hypothetical protein